MMLIFMVRLDAKRSILVEVLISAYLLREIVPLGASAGWVLTLAVAACEGAIND